MELTIAYYGRRLQDDESMAPSRNLSFMLRDPKESQHLYYENNALEMLVKLLEKGLTELSKSKRAKEIGRTNHLKYCRYHGIINHSIEKQDIQGTSHATSKGRKDHTRRRRH